MSSIIMMLALWALLGVITLICWCRDLRQRRLAIRWATWPLVDPADKGDGPESVQHGPRDAAMDLAAATDQAISLSLRQCELAVQDLIAIGSAEEKPSQNDKPLVDPADKGDGPESVQHGLRDVDMDLAALRLSSGDWRKFPSTDELKSYVGVLTGDAPRQSNARLLALVLAILVGVIGTLVILAVWLSPTPEQIQAARNGQGEQGTQQSTPAGGAQPSLLGLYSEYEQSTSTPAFEQSAAARAPEQSTSTPAFEQSAAARAPEQSTSMPAFEQSAAARVPEQSTSTPAFEQSAAARAPEQSTSMPAFEQSAAARAPEQSTSTPAFEQSAAARAPEQSTSTPAFEQSAAARAPE